MPTKSRIRNKLSKYKRQKDLQIGLLGNYNYEVEVPGRANYVYVRLAGQVVSQVYNDRVNPVLDLQVYVGYDEDEPGLLQVLGVRSDLRRYGTDNDNVGYTQAHHRTHEWMAFPDGGNDVVFSELRQFMPLRPTPVTTGVALHINRGLLFTDNRKLLFVTGATAELYSLLPATGSRYAYVGIDRFGSPIVTGGVIRDSLSITYDDAPNFIPGTYPIAMVRLYQGQTVIEEAYSSTDLADLRFPFPQSFLNLYDVPAHYTGSANRGLFVNSTETGLEYRNITGSAPILSVQEEDGTPNLSNIHTIKVTNGTLADGGAGIAIVNTGAGAGATGSVVTFSTPYASRPSPTHNGDLFFPSDGSVIERTTGTAAWQPWGPIFPLTPPPTGGWGWINQGSGTVTSDYGGLIFYIPSTTPGPSVKIYKRNAPATPYTITAGFLVSTLPGKDGVSDPSYGLCFRAATGTFSTLWSISNSSGAGVLAVRKWNSPTSFSADYFSENWSAYGGNGLFWMQISDNGVNRICRISGDGKNWAQVHAVSRTDFLTATEVGIAIRYDGVANEAGYLNLIHWKEE